MPRDRREAEPVAGAGQRAEELLDVRLVARSVTAEDVGVDHDQRLAHPAASR